MHNVIQTPGNTWAELSTRTDDSPMAPGVSGYFKESANGIYFYGEDGQVFAFLVNNRHNEQFFVTARANEKGSIWYMYTTSDVDHVRLGLKDLSLREERDLASSIVDGLKIKKAMASISKLGIGLDQLVQAANGHRIPQDHFAALIEAGLISPPGYRPEGAFFIASPLGRELLKREGFSFVNASSNWLRGNETVAA